MTVAAFDTLKLVRRLEATGMPVPQATGFAEASAEIMLTELATKADLRELRADVFGELERRFSGQSIEVEQLRTDMEELRRDLRTEIAASKSETLRWVVPLMLGQMALSLAILLRVSS